MARLWTDRTRLTIALGCGLLIGLSSACRTIDPEPEARPKQPARHGGDFWTASERAKLEACYAEEKVHHPNLSVHTEVWFFARDGKIVFVDLELPEKPQLARCLSNVMLGSKPFEIPVAPGSDALSSGALRLDFGSPPATPLPRPTLAELRARVRRTTLAALQQGALRESDAPVRELRNPAPPWPTAPMRAELETCYQDSLKSHPGLVLHRDVIYLARGSKVLLADVSIPEAPELRSCVQQRIAGWSSPFSDSVEGATLSGFFIDLGAPEEFPAPPASLNAELERRRALVQRARDLGLIAGDDPLLDRFKPVTDPVGHDAELNR